MEAKVDSRTTHFQRAPLRGFTLVELLMVLVLLGIGAGVIVALFDPSVQRQLQSAAETVASDLAYARNLAVSNGSTYRVEFDADDNLYRLTHVGTDTNFDQLPESPFLDSENSSTSQVMRLADLPGLGSSLKLWGVSRVSDSNATAVTDVQFTPLGGTDRSEVTRIWLTVLEGDKRLAIPVQINPVTGLAEIGQVRTIPSNAGVTIQSDLVDTVQRVLE